MGDPEMRPPLPAQASGGDRCPEMLLGERCHHAHGHDGWHRFTHSVPAPSSSSPSPDGDEMFGEPTAEEVRRGAELFRQIVESSSPAAETRWCTAEMVCVLCLRPWVAIYPAAAPGLECPGCGYLNALPEERAS